MMQSSRLRSLLPALALLLLIGLAACSGKPRELARVPLGIDFHALQLMAQDEVLQLELVVLNHNDGPRQLAGLKVQFGVDELPQTEASQTLALDISARGREIVRLQLPLEASSRARLEALSGGELSRLPWQLEAEFIMENTRNHQARASGWLYRVPGQPGRFR